jgi:hypothetical protein
MSAGLLAYSLSGAEPVKPTPSIQGDTNAVPLLRPMTLSLPPLPFYEQSVPSLFIQRFSERATDPLNPQTLTSLYATRGAYERFTHETGKDVLIGSLKRTGQDFGVSIILPNFELNGKPLTEFVQGFVFGSLQGPQRRDFAPRTSVYQLPSDSTFRPHEQHPLLYSLGFDPLRSDPKGYGTIVARNGTRMFRWSTSHQRGETSFDVFDDLVYLRLGLAVEYRQFHDRSQGFISATLPIRNLPLTLSVGSNPRGNTGFTASLNRTF